MIPMEIVKAVLIHVAVPLAGLGTFVWLRKTMRASEVERPPVVPIFIIFSTYGGWLMIALTLLFWYWSGIALMGLMYLAVVAPIVMIGMALMLYRQRRLSRYHSASFVASGIYPFILGVLARVAYDTWASSIKARAIPFQRTGRCESPASSIEAACTRFTRTW